MGLLAMAKAKAKASSNTTTTSSSTNNQSGMSFLLVFFPQENNNNNSSTTTISPTSIPTTTTTTLKRTNSNNLILSKAQFTISICALLLFFTLLLFTLSTFEPTISNITPTPRRALLHKPPSHSYPHTTKSKPQQKNWLLPKLFQQPNKSLYLTSSNNHHNPTQYALQRMGILHRRGTRSMTDLIICHVADETTHHDFRLFLRLIHRSGLTAKSDVVFLFSSRASSSAFSEIISEENSSFSSLISLQTEPGRSSVQIMKSRSGFDLARFYSVKKAEVAEPLWGKRIRSNLSNVEGRGKGEGEGGINNGGGELVLSYGSVVSFDATELDPENSLAGFLDRVPLSLRRWACYPMLLGRVRRNFKHVMLIDVKNTLILKDPLGRVRNRSPESVFLFSKKNSDKTRSTQRRVNSGVIIGGSRGVRRLCNAVLVEIVREAMQQQQQRKKKNSVSDSAILSQLVGSEFMWKNGNNVNFVSTIESIPEASSLSGRNSGTATSSLLNHAIIQRGGSNHDLSTVIKEEICSSLVDSSVYRDC